MKKALPILILVILLSVSCTSSYKFTESYSTKNISDSVLNHSMLMVLYPDEMIETRVALENSMASEFQKNNVEMICGYKRISSYENIENRIEELKSAMKSKNVKNLLIIDPIRSIEHDPSEYHNKVAVYRAMGMESSVFWSSVAELSKSADASNYIMGVSIWNIDTEDFIWQGTFDIKAPGGYDLQNAKEYAKQFSKVILNTLKE